MDLHPNFLTPLKRLPNTDELFMELRRAGRPMQQIDIQIGAIAPDLAQRYHRLEGFGPFGDPECDHRKLGDLSVAPSRTHWSLPGLRRNVFPVHPRQFALLAAGPEEEIRRLQEAINLDTP